MVCIDGKGDEKGGLKGVGKGDCWGWGIVVLQAIPGSLILQLSDTTPPGTTKIKH